MKVDSQIEAPGTQSPAESDVGQNMSPRGHDHVIDVGIPFDDHGRRWFDQVAETSVWEARAQCPKSGGREYDVADLAQTNHQDVRDLRT